MKLVGVGVGVVVGVCVLVGVCVGVVVFVGVCVGVGVKHISYEIIGGGLNPGETAIHPDIGGKEVSVILV